MPYSVDHSSFDSQNATPRESSRVRGDANSQDYPRFNQPHRPPISEAVSSAIDKVDTSNYVPPELIAQITENVIKQLKTSGLESGTPVPQMNKPFPPPPQPPTQQPIPLSPSTASAPSPPGQRNMYTPPSPHKHQDHLRHESPEYRSAAPQDMSKSLDELPKVHFKERRPSSPYSDSNESIYTRPKGPTRLSTGRDETTLERIWGQLFDEESNPTVRLGQFLRGLAVHIIEDYEPRHSIVITPAKMIKYYEDVRLPNELYPWSVIFDDERSNISRLYRELSCQHHLVQERNDEKPDIPGLTPVGFQRWVTLLIQAHPDEEYERLQKAVLDMPISNPDEKKERFPKELSRRLFPSTGDRKGCERLDSAIAEHANVEIPKRSKRDKSPTYTTTGLAAEPTPIPHTHRREPSISVDTQNFVPSSLERERAPYSNTPSEAIIDDTNPFPPPPQPIERERKPYSAVPGCGKAFEDEPRAGKPRSESIASKVGRSNSTTTPRPTPANANGPRPMEMPKPEVHNHHNATNARRQRSPSFSRATNDVRRPDSDTRGYLPPFQGPTAPSFELIDDDARRYARERTDRARRPGDEELRAYGEGPGGRTRYDRVADSAGPHRSSYPNEEDFYRTAGRGGPGNGYDYSQQPYGGPVYR
ncbi:hypothetical protein MMC07_003947 [Pseudocyphellaria aurata]|nr:hypothetical protein [Pseudocyphellaria aurata]